MRPALLGLLAAIAAAPAWAADLPTSKSPPAPMLAAPAQYDWTGFYVGGHLGWAWSDDLYSVYNSVSGAFVGSGSTSPSTFHGGGQVGYNYMFASHLVLGALAGVQWGTSTSTTTSNAAGTNVSTTKDSNNVSGDVKVVAGYAIGDFLPYVTGGWAWSSSTSSRTQLVGVTGLATPGTVDSSSVSRNGWDLGAGVNYRFWGNWSVFGEYDYTQYGKDSILYPAAQRVTRSSLDANSLTFGVNYKF